jgi:hypothetical protein
MTGRKKHDPDSGAPALGQGGRRRKPAEAPPAPDAQEPSTLEAFDEEGAGIAPKE